MKLQAATCEVRKETIYRLAYREVCLEIEREAKKEQARLAMERR